MIFKIISNNNNAALNIISKQQPHLLCLLNDTKQTHR